MFRRFLNPLAGYEQKFLCFLNQAFRRRIEQRFPDFRGESQIFTQGNTPAFIRQREKALGDNQPQAGQKRSRHLALLFIGEDVDDTSECFRNGAGMYCGIGGDTDFRAFNHAPERFRVAAFTDKHHVRSRARGVACGRQEGLQMFRNGALRNWPTRIGNGVKIKFNGRFISADVPPAFFDDVSQNRGQQR